VSYDIRRCIGQKPFSERRATKPQAERDMLERYFEHAEYYTPTAEWRKTATWTISDGRRRNTETKRLE